MLRASGALCSGELFDGIMLRCALNVAWIFMLRAKEYCDSNGVDFEMILGGVDLKFVTTENGDGIILGVALQFRKTKTDQEAFGGCKTLYRSGVKDLCAVEALIEMRRMAPQRFDQGSEALKPLFRWANGQVLKRTQVQNILQRAAVACGLLKERFMSHSLRIGGASALFQATGEIEVVKRTGRWSSSAVQRYLRDGEVALRDMASKMANVDQKLGALHVRCMQTLGRRAQVIPTSQVLIKFCLWRGGKLRKTSHRSVQRAP